MAEATIAGATPDKARVYAVDGDGELAGQRDEPLEAPKYVLHPRESALRRHWDVATGLLVIVSSWMVPFLLSFTWWEESDWKYLNRTVDVWFCLDIALNFRTGYTTLDGDVEMDPKRIARHYGRTWFLVDLVASVPLDIFLGGGSKTSKSVKILKLQKLPKLLRLGRILRYLKQYAKYYALILVIFSLGVLVHLAACLWVWLLEPCAEDSDGAFSYAVGESDLELCALSRDAAVPGHGGLYSRALHVALVLVLGVSSSHMADETDILSPQYVGYESKNHDVFVYANVLFVIGSVMTALLFANVFVLVASRNNREAEFRARIERIKDEMARHEMPLPVQQRVLGFYEYVWTNNVAAEGAQRLLSDKRMAPALIRDVTLSLNRDLLASVSLFEGASDAFLARICGHLQTRVYLPGDLVIAEGEVGAELFLLVRGVVDVFSATSSRRVTLRDGACFGEIALLRHVARSRSVQAVVTCNLRVLDRADFESTLHLFPEFAEHITAIANTRFARDGLDLQGVVHVQPRPTTTTASTAPTSASGTPEPRTWTPMDGRWATPTRKAAKTPGPPPLSAPRDANGVAVYDEELPRTASAHSSIFGTLADVPEGAQVLEAMERTAEASTATTQRLNVLERDMGELKQQMDVVQRGIGTLLSRSTAAAGEGEHRAPTS